MNDTKALLFRLRDLAVEKKTFGGDADVFGEAADALEAAQAEIEQKDHRITALEAALKQSEAWFREYEAGHRAKVKPSDDPSTQAAANDKADRNRDRADFCAHALGDTHDPK